MQSAIKREVFLSRLQSVAPGLSPKDVVEQSSCFTADTVIHTLAGDFTVSELLARGDESFLVFSTDGKSIKVGRASGLRMTRRNACVHLVTFDTGDKIKLTKDHLVMMRDGTYKRVDELQPGDSIMPFNSWYRKDGYRVIYRKISGKPDNAARFVYDEMCGGGRDGKCIHHLDHNPANDSPENLQLMTRAEHGRLHALIMPPMHRPGAAAKQAKAMMGNKNGVGPKPGTAKAMKGNQHAKGCRGNTSPRTEKQLKALSAGRASRLKAKQTCPNNHKVVSVEYVGREDVYDLSVPVYHNFAANGIFIHNCFVFKNGRVYTFNDEVACRAPSGLAKEFRGAVTAQPLLDYLAKLPDDDITITASTSSLQVRGKRRGADIRMEAELLLSFDAVEKPEEWRKLPFEFTEAVEIVSSSSSSDDSRFCLTCIHFAPDYIEACDNFQLTRYEMATGVEKNFLVRHDALSHVVPFGMTEISETEGWLHFKNPSGLVLSCRRYLDEFPDMGKILDVKGTKTKLPGGLAEDIERAEIFSKDNNDDGKVMVELRPGKMKLIGNGVVGKAWTFTNMSYDGPALAFLISPRMLTEISKKQTECEIAKDRLKITGSKFVYIACLSKPKEVKEDLEEEDDREMKHRTAETKQRERFEHEARKKVKEFSTNGHAGAGKKPKKAAAQEEE